MKSAIRIELLSDTTFSRGDGTPGEVDIEVVHDEHLGLPYLPGRGLKGLLREAWLAMAPVFPEDASFARELLGIEGALDPSGSARLRIGDATVSDEVRRWVEYATQRADHPVSAADILRAFTGVRHQTARDRASGGSPETGTLRASRVVLRGLVLWAPLVLDGLAADHLRVLARILLNARHVGLGRNRGRGHVHLSLWHDGKDMTREAADLGA